MPNFLGFLFIEPNLEMLESKWSDSKPRPHCSWPSSSEPHSAELRPHSWDNHIKLTMDSSLSYVPVVKKAEKTLEGRGLSSV